MALFGRPSQREEERAVQMRDWMRKRNPMAIVSLVLGILSLIEFGVLLVFGIAGIVCGLIALGQLRRVKLDRDKINPAAPTPSAASEPRDVLNDADAELEPPIDILDDEYSANMPRAHGRRLAWAGIITSAVSLGLAAMLYSGAVNLRGDGPTP